MTEGNFMECPYCNKKMQLGAILIFFNIFSQQPLQLPVCKALLLI